MILGVCPKLNIVCSLQLWPHTPADPVIQKGVRAPYCVIVVAENAENRRVHGNEKESKR